MNASNWSISETTGKISRLAVNSYTNIEYSTFCYVSLVIFLPNAQPFNYGTFN